MKTNDETTAPSPKKGEINLKLFTTGILDETSPTLMRNFEAMDVVDH